MDQCRASLCLHRFAPSSASACLVGPREIRGDLSADAYELGEVEQQLYCAVLDRLPFASVLVFDRELRIRLIAGPGLKRAGLTASDFEGRTVLDVVFPPQGTMLVGHYRAALDGERRSVEYRSRLDGRWYWLQVVPLMEEAGVVVSALAFSVDVSERKAADDARRISDERFQRIFEHGPLGMVLTDCLGSVTQANDAFCRFLGTRRDDLIGLGLGALIVAEDRRPIEEGFAALLAGEQDSVALEVRWWRRDAPAVWGALTAMPVVADGEPGLSAMVLVEDITARKRTQAELEHSAAHDPLTGLRNRRGFEEELDRGIAQSRRSRSSAALLVLDVDGLKAVNDTFGHLSGDQLLRAVSDAMLGRLRAGDLVARLGGDEFGMLLADVTMADARKVGEELLAAIRDIRLDPPASGRASVSVGLIIIPPDGGDAQQLLGEADAMMYSSKKSGGDRLTVAYPPTGNRRPERGAKVRQLDCRAVVPGCDAVFEGETDQEVLAQAVEHARADHGIAEVDDDLLEQIRAQISDV